jgi:hypothetical protein
MLFFVKDFVLVIKMTNLLWMLILTLFFSLLCGLSHSIVRNFAAFHWPRWFTTVKRPINSNYPETYKSSLYAHSICLRSVIVLTSTPWSSKHFFHSIFWTKVLCSHLPYECYMLRSSHSRFHHADNILFEGCKLWGSSLTHCSLNLFWNNNSVPTSQEAHCVFIINADFLTLLKMWPLFILKIVRNTKRHFIGKTWRFVMWKQVVCFRGLCTFSPVTCGFFPFSELL